MKSTMRKFDAAALRDNARAIKKQATAPNLLAVVKADAYGHGLTFAVNALHDIADGFAVTNISCAQKIRATLADSFGDIDKPILLLAGADDEAETMQAATLKLWLVVHQPSQIAHLSKLSHSANLAVFVKTNNGMNRLGFSPADAATAMDALAKMPQVTKIGLLSHFACADTADGINDALPLLQPLREKATMISLGNSAATLLHPNIGDEWARVGIALYGASPAPTWRSRQELGLRAVMTMQAPIIAIQNLQSGDSVGYGATWQAKKTARIGIVTCGYNNGYPQNNQSWDLPPKAANSPRAKAPPWALVENEKAPVIGRPSMEMLALDISNCPAAIIGSTATLWGDSPSIDEVAIASNRLSYDLLCAAG